MFNTELKELLCGCAILEEGFT